MKRALTLVLVLGAVVLLTSCYEYAETYTIERDGSGSFTMDIGMSSMISSMMDLGESMGEAAGAAGEEATGATEVAPPVEGEAPVTAGETTPPAEGATPPGEGAEPPTEGITVTPEADATGGDVSGDETNPFKDMKAAADKINKEGDPNGLITGAEFKQFDEGDMKHSVFTVNVNDMTKVLDAVKGEWWQGAPGAGVEAGTTETPPPFTIEKLENGNLLFIKVIAVPDSNGVIPYPEGEGKDEAAAGGEEKPEGEDAAAGDGATTPDEGAAEGGDAAKPEDDSEGKTEGGDVIGMLGLSSTAYAQEEAGAADPGAEAEPGDTGAETGGATDGETGGAVDGATGDMDMNMDDMMAQAFQGKFYTITLNAPKIVSTNGETLTPEPAAEGAKAPLPAVQWKIPMGDLMGSTGFYLKCTAEIKLRERNPVKQFQNLVTGQEEEGTPSMGAWAGLIGIIVVIVVVIAAAKGGKKKAKAKA